MKTILMLVLGIVIGGVCARLSGDAGPRGNLAGQGRAGAVSNQASGPEPASPRATVSGAPAEELLSAKIKRLQAWAKGDDRTLTRPAALQILTEWSERDPAAALEFVRAAGRFPGRDEAYAIPLAKIARLAPQEAARWLAAGWVTPESRKEIVGDIVRSLEHDASEAALDLADSCGWAESFGYGELLGTVAGLRPQKAVASLERLSGEARRRALVGMISVWSGKDAEQALTWYLAQGDRDSRATELLAVQCLKDGRHTLAELATRFSFTEAQKGNVLARLEAAGVAVDPGQLAELNEKYRRGVIWAATRKLEDAPDRVLALVQGTMKEDQQASALYRGWEEWLASDRPAALDWLNGLSDRKLASALNERWQREELLKNPDGALAASETMSDAASRKELVGAAMQRLAWEAPSKAAAWLAEHPGTELGESLVGSLTERYLDEDDAGAMAWLVKMKDGSTKDDALVAAARFWVDTEVDFATASLAAIGDAAKREQCRFSLYVRLAASDSAKAEVWLQGQGLAPEVLQSWKVLAGKARAPRGWID